MVITDKIVFLQLEKTGSTHIEEKLLKLKGAYKIGKHNTIDSFSLEKRAALYDKVIVGSIRNPWDWYVSVWAFGCMQKGRLYDRLTEKNMKRKLKLLCEEPETLFHLWKTKAIVETYRNHKNPHLFRKWLKMITSAKNAPLLEKNYNKSPIHDSIGLYTYRFLRMYIKDFLDNYMRIKTYDAIINLTETNFIPQYVIKTESLEEDLLALLRKTNLILSEELIASIIDGKNNRANKSKRNIEYQHYYDRETKDIVYEKDQTIIKRFGYRFNE